MDGLSDELKKKLLRKVHKEENLPLTIKNNKHMIQTEMSKTMGSEVRQSGFTKSSLFSRNIGIQTTEPHCLQSLGMTFNPTEFQRNYLANCLETFSLQYFRFEIRTY